jgi:rhomboid protease GluP
MSTARAQEYLASIPVVTKILLIFNIVVHVAIFVSSLPLAYVAINPILIIVRGEYYRLVSSAFVHGGLLHIGMNMSTLLAIGGALETQYGSLTMLFLTSWALVLTGSTFVLLVW